MGMLLMVKPPEPKVEEEETNFIICIIDSIQIFFKF